MDQKRESQSPALQRIGSGRYNTLREQREKELEQEREADRSFVKELKEIIARQNKK